MEYMCSGRHDPMDAFLQPCLGGTKQPAAGFESLIAKQETHTATNTAVSLSHICGHVTMQPLHPTSPKIIIMQHDGAHGCGVTGYS